MTTQQPEALRLANILRGIDARSLFANEKLSAASAALENQHARITELEAKLEAVGAGGVGPLMGIAALSAQAEGWRPIETAPKGELVLLWSEITRGEPFIGDWAEYARYNHPQFTHWSRWDGLPPTSAEGVEHG
jgi:hypothetical protein